jgi:hypothetical protein
VVSSDTTQRWVCPKDDVNDEVPNGNPEILIPFNGMYNWDGELKLGGRTKGDHATHF